MQFITRITGKSILNQYFKNQMSHLSQKELDLFTNKILEDYDAKIPGTIFKEKIEIGNEDALLIQSYVARLREKRGEVIIGYKIGCVS